MNSTPNTPSRPASPKETTTSRRIFETMADEKLCAIGPAVCERFGLIVDQSKSHLIKYPARCIIRYPYVVSEDAKETAFPRSGELVFSITYDTGVPEIKIVSTEGDYCEIPIDFREVAARYVEILGRGYSRSIFHIGGPQDNATLGGLWGNEIEEAQKFVPDDATIVVQGVRVDLKTFVFPGI